MTSKLKLLVGASALTCSIIGGTSAAHAAGTDAGVDINNTVTVDFQVGGVGQTQQSASDTFQVDRVIRFTLVEDTTGSRGGDSSASPNEDDVVTFFTLTNTSNEAADFDLSATETADANNILDGTGLLVFVESGATPGYQAAEDTATFVDELAADDSVTIYVLGDIAATAANGQNADVTLTATAHVAGAAGLGDQYSTSGTGDALISDDTDVNTAGVETIFGDTGRDGVELAVDGYVIESAVLSVFKSSSVISDPFSSANPKAIPGAIVEYCISVANASGAALAESISLADNIGGIAGITFEPGTIFVDATVANAGTATQTCSGGTAVTDATGDDAGEFAGGIVSGDLSNIAGGTTLGLRFRVEINP